MSDLPPKIAVLELPAMLFDEVEEYAQRHGLPRAEALRYLIIAGLRAEAAAMLRGKDT